MTWFKVDDGFHSHPKVARLYDGDLGDSAVALWMLAGSWCARELTDGFVSTGQTKRLGVNPGAAQELVRVGLWELAEGGFQFHDWLDYQPSKAKVLADREATRLRVERHRAKVSDESSCNGVTNTVGNGVGTHPPDPVFRLPEKKEETTTHSAAGGPSFGTGRPSAASVGHDLMMNATGRAYDLGSWRKELERIGMKPAEEGAAVVRAIQACEFCRANRLLATPGYVLKHWDRYAAGNPPLKGVVRAIGKRGPSGASRIPTMEEYAADAALGNGWAGWNA